MKSIVESSYTVERATSRRNLFDASKITVSPTDYKVTRVSDGRVRYIDGVNDPAALRLFKGEAITDVERLDIQLRCGLTYAPAAVSDQLLLTEAFRKIAR